LPERFKTSVRKLVEFACRTGDLIHDPVAGPTALEGQRAHTRLQSQRASTEQAEVKLETTVGTDSAELHISGRADLVDLSGPVPIVSEIKSCYAPPARINPSITAVHHAQLKVYGYALLQQHRDEIEPGIATVCLRLIWVNLIADEITVDEQYIDYDVLCRFTIDAAKRYLEWLQVVESHRREVRRTAAELSFPQLPPN